jgi:long-chain acyl-CoA synthetase
LALRQGVKRRIANEDRNDLATGEIGEIILRSQAMTVGYWGLLEETARTIQEGWLYSGDFGKFDDEK